MKEIQKKTRQIIHNESKSLWNYALSPGWTQEEVAILKKALQKFGVGRWKKIIQSQCLPRKTIGQIYMQTQRLVGQQSLGEFMGIHLDLEKVYLDNYRKTDVKRKYNAIINTGDNPTKAERQRRIEENKKKYGLKMSFVNSIKLPVLQTSCDKILLNIDEIETEKYTTIEKLNHLQILKKAIEKKIEYLNDPTKINVKQELDADSVEYNIDLQMIDEDQYEVL